MSTLNGINNPGFTGSTSSLHPNTTTSFTPHPTPWHLQLSWVLANLSSMAAPVVTTIYFLFIYPTMPQEEGLNIYDINIHVMNLVLILFDNSLSARPVRLLHIYQPILYGLVYMVFNIAYFFLEPPPLNLIYPIFDWSQPLSADGASLALSLIGMPVLQMAFFGFYRLKLKLRENLN